MNRNLYISKIYKFDEKKKAILLNPILEKARKINDNANYNDIELILLIYLNLKLYYNKEEMINNYLSLSLSFKINKIILIDGYYLNLSKLDIV